MKIEVYVQTNKVGSRVTAILDLEAGLTEEEIDELAQQTMFDMIEWSWTRKDAS